MMSLLVTAIRTLTVIPVPGRNAALFNRSLPFFWIVGAGLGGVIYGVAAGSAVLFPSMWLLDGLIVTLAGVLLTGAIHLDGLADVSDGFGGGKTRERILEIFKDSRLGTFGVSAVMFDLAAKIILIGRLIQCERAYWIIAAMILSRTAQSLALAFVPYAGRSDGTALVFTAPRSAAPAIVSSLFAVCCCFFIMNYKPLCLSLLLCAAACCLFLFYCFRRIGGITGDCIGTTNEIAELSVLVSGVMYCSSPWWR